MGPAAAQGQVDDQVEHVLGQVLGDRALLEAVLVVTCVFVRPVDRFHLNVSS